MRREQDGFTIVEVMISMAIFAFGLVSLIGLQMATLRGNTIGRQVTEATQIAQTWAAYLNTLPYTNALLSGSSSADFTFTGVTGGYSSSQAYPLSLSSGQHAYANNNINTTFTASAFPNMGAAGSVAGYELYWGVQNVSFTGGPTPDLKRIGILIRWKEKGGYYHNVVFITQKCTAWNLLNNNSGICL